MASNGMFIPFIGTELTFKAEQVRGKLAGICFALITQKTFILKNLHRLLITQIYDDLYTINQ